MDRGEITLISTGAKMLLQEMARELKMGEPEVLEMAIAHTRLYLAAVKVSLPAFTPPHK